MKDTEDFKTRDQDLTELDKEHEEILSKSDLLVKEFKTREQDLADMRGNRRVLMPGPSPPLVEAKFATRSDVWDKTFTRYRKVHCNEDGEQVATNLSKTLSKKIAKLDVLILEADKGKKFVVVDESTYVRMSEDHTANDILVDSDGIRDSQRVLSATSKTVANILCLGSSHSRRNFEHCFDNSGSSAMDVPNMKMLPKVHKPPGPAGHLQSRPVVAAAAGCLQEQRTSSRTTWSRWFRPRHHVSKTSVQRKY